MFKNNKGSLFLNIMLLIMVSSIITITIFNRSMNSVLAQKIAINSYQDSLVEKLGIDNLKSRVEYEVIRETIETSENPSLSLIENTISGFLKNNYPENGSTTCILDKEDSLTVLCELNNEDKLFSIIVDEFQTDIYDYSMISNGSIYFNGASSIDGLIQSNGLYLTNHTLNDSSVINPTFIEPLLDIESKQDNFPYLKGFQNYITNDIYTRYIQACEATVLAGCYQVASGNVQEINSQSLTQIPDQAINYFHTANLYQRPSIYDHYLDSSDKISFLTFDFNNNINDILNNKLATGNVNYGDQIDPYKTTAYNQTEDIYCYTSLLTAGSCSDKDKFALNFQETVNENFNNMDKLTLFTKNIITLNDLSYFGSNNDGLIIVDGDLIIENLNKTLVLAGDIIVTGNIIVSGNTDYLEIDGSIYSFGTVVFHLNGGQTPTEKNNSGFIYAKENIIIKDSETNGNLKTITLNSHFYAEGSILIETTKNNQLIINGGLYAGAEDRNANITYPLKIGDFDLNYAGIMINSYCGLLNLSGQYILSTYESDTKTTINLADKTISQTTAITSKKLEHYYKFSFEEVI